MDGNNFFTAVDGKKLATPLLLCLVCIELSDIVFALDSVPAIFGVTKDPFIVYTSNLFAISGLRSLFGVLSQSIDDLKYLDKVIIWDGINLLLTRINLQYFRLSEWYLG
jgi:predicted tellurium resistance membrane protein TerC